MLYLPITKSWIISRTARAIYFVCALLAATLFGALFATLSAMAFAGVHSLGSFPTAATMIRAILLPGICGAALLCVAMWYFWFTFDRSSWRKKALWFFPLYFVLALGPALYFFFVYLRDPEVASTCAHEGQPVREAVILNSSSSPSVPEPSD